LSEPIYNEQYERMTYVINNKICHAYKVYEDDEKTAWILHDDRIIWKAKN